MFTEIATIIVTILAANLKLSWKKSDIDLLVVRERKPTSSLCAACMGFCAARLIVLVGIFLAEGDKSCISIL